MLINDLDIYVDIAFMFSSAVIYGDDIGSNGTWCRRFYRIAHHTHTYLLIAHYDMYRYNIFKIELNKNLDSTQIRWTKLKELDINEDILMDYLFDMSQAFT